MQVRGPRRLCPPLPPALCLCRDGCWFGGGLVCGGCDFAFGEFELLNDSDCRVRGVGGGSGRRFARRDAVRARSGATDGLQIAHRQFDTVRRRAVCGKRRMRSSGICGTPGFGKFAGRCGGRTLHRPACCRACGPELRMRRLIAGLLYLHK